MLDLRLLVAKCVTQVRAVGVLGTATHAVAQASRLARRNLTRDRDDFDIRYGTDTGGTNHLWMHKIDSPNAKHGNNYASTSEQHIEVLLRPLPRSACFVDLGCGKGRPLIVAARLGFETIVGVEFVREFADVAVANLRKTGTVGTVICADVVTYDFPARPLIVYLGNPFGAAVMSAVANKLRLHQEELWVVYVNPRHGDLFESWMNRQPLTPPQATLFSPDSVSLWHNRRSFQ